MCKGLELSHDTQLKRNVLVSDAPIMIFMANTDFQKKILQATNKKERMKYTQRRCLFGI